MEALTSSSSSKQQLFLKKDYNRNRNRGGGFSPSKTLFSTRPEQLGFFRFQKCKNVDFSHSISLQLIKAIEPVSCSTPFPSSEEDAQCDMMTAEAPTQETYTGKTVHVKFLLQKECVFGERFLLVGDDPIFGMWNPSDAIPLDWSEGHIWSVELDIPVEKFIRFKFVLKGATEELVWQPDPNRILQTWETKNTIVLLENWENAEAQKITEEEPGANPIEELTADKSSELNLSEDMSNPKEDLVVADKLSNPKEVLLIQDNMSYPKEELLVDDNTSNPKEELLVADNMSCPKEEELLVADNITNTKEEQTVAENQNVVGSNSIAVTVNKSTSIDDEDDLVDYEGEPVLVPGLAPLPTTVPKDSLPAVVDTMSTKDASVELNGNAVEVEDGNIPEKHKKKDLDENIHQENTTVTKISDDGPEKEQTVPEELPLFQLEQASFLDLLRSDFHWANRRVRQLLKDLGLFRF